MNCCFYPLIVVNYRILLLISEGFSVNMPPVSPQSDSPLPFWKYLVGFVTVFLSFFLIELLAFILLKPVGLTGLAFGSLWAVLLACFVLLFPRKAARIIYGVLYFVLLLWALAQAGYYQVFGKMMWLSTIGYAGEGAAFLGDVLRHFPFAWWLGMALMVALGVVVIWKFPHPPTGLLPRVPYVLSGAIMITGLFLPQWRNPVKCWAMPSASSSST